MFNELTTKNSVTFLNDLTRKSVKEYAEVMRQGYLKASRKAKLFQIP